LSCSALRARGLASLTRLRCDRVRMAARPCPETGGVLVVLWQQRRLGPCQGGRGWPVREWRSASGDASPKQTRLVLITNKSSNARVKKPLLTLSLKVKSTGVLLKSIATPSTPTNGDTMPATVALKLLLCPPAMPTGTVNVMFRVNDPLTICAGETLKLYAAVLTRTSG